eukprot:COSAG01_NODE_17_length_39991_cov_30.596160_8_plen_258_part_00
MGISDQMWRFIPLLLIVVAAVLLHGGRKLNPTQALSFLGIGGAAAALNCRGSDSFFCYARRCGQCEDDAVRWQEMLRAAEAALHGDDVAVKEDCNVEVVNLSAPGTTATWRDLQRSTKPLLVRGGMAAEWAQRLSQELSTEQQHVLGSLLHQPRVNSEAIKAAMLFRLLQGEAYGGERLQLRENSRPFVGPLVGPLVHSFVRFSGPSAPACLSACLPVSRHGVPCCLQMIATPRSCRWWGRSCRCWQGGAPCRRRKP